MMGEYNLLKLAPKITTPLSIVSLIIIILYLLYKQVLNLPIFSRLDETGTYQVVTQILFYLFILAIVGLVIGLILYAVLRLKNANKENANKENVAIDEANGLKVVDVAVIDEFEEVVAFRKSWFKENDEQIEEKGYFPIIDIKVRNVSSSPIFLKELIFNVMMLKAEPNDFHPLAQPVSWEYNVLFKVSETAQVKKIKLSQVVKPKDVDRFVILIGRDGFNLNYVLYKVELILQYNEKDSIDLGMHEIKVHAPIVHEPLTPVAIKALPQ
jgi:phosphate/sulfate permease